MIPCDCLFQEITFLVDFPSFKTLLVLCWRQHSRANQRVVWKTTQTHREVKSFTHTGLQWKNGGLAWGTAVADGWFSMQAACRGTLRLPFFCMLIRRRSRRAKTWEQRETHSNTLKSSTAPSHCLSISLFLSFFFSEARAVVCFLTQLFDI